MFPNGIIFVPSFVRISPFVLKLKRTDGRTDGHTHSHIHKRTDYKRKFVPVGLHVIKVYRGVGAYLRPFLTSTLDMCYWPRPITLGKKSDTHLICDWVGPRAGLDDSGERKTSCFCLHSNPGLSSTYVDAVPTTRSQTPIRLYKYINH